MSTSEDFSNKRFEAIRPIIFCSKCITFENCRWNGAVIPSKEVELLKQYVDFLTYCPEMDIGLGSPRYPLRLVEQREKILFVQPDTKLDFSDEMIDYCETTIETLKRRQIDGIILKSKSPSCGPNQVNLYRSVYHKPIKRKTAGIFGSYIMENMSHLPIVHEELLTDDLIWERFLTQIYIIADLRKVENNLSMRILNEFHSRNKFILMAAHQYKLRELGQIVANQAYTRTSDLFKAYKRKFFDIISTTPTYRNNINVLMHTLGYFKKFIEPKEKKYVLSEINYYRKGLISLNVLIHIFRDLIIKYDMDYLKEQSFFNPYPEELLKREKLASKEEYQPQLQIL